MITQAKLAELATKKQTTQLNIRREYVQNLFLAYFYRHKNSESIFFKGGTALRLIYNSPRFSEDLDFSTSMSDVRKIEDILQNTLNEIEREGVNTEIPEAKKTSGGYLAIVNFQLDQNKVAITLEISFRDKGAKGEIITIVNDLILPYTIMVLKPEQLISQKIMALFARQKPRDFYDLYFILRANLLPVEERHILTKVIDLLKKSNISFRKELEVFLPRSHWAIVKNFKPALEKEIQRFV